MAEGSWMTVKRAGLGAGDVVLAKTASGARARVRLTRELPGKGARRWTAENLETRREVQVTKVWIAAPAAAGKSAEAAAEPGE